MSILEETKFLLKQNKILPDKFKGQNFLISREVLEKIIKVANLKPGENVLEIGPGLGILTKALIQEKVNPAPFSKEKKCGINLKVVELDKNIIKILEPLAQMNNFTLIEGNILKINLEEKISKDFLKNYKIVANLPYNISSRFLRIFLEHKYPPQEMILMLQKEVGERIINKDGKWSKLSVMCNFYSQPEYLFTVSRENFYPQPRVDSALIKFVIHPAGEVTRRVDSKKFWRLINIGFSSKRRTLANNLAHGLKVKKEEVFKLLEKSGLERNIRAEKLNIEDWLKLINFFK
jgi:16S rRNA (adenine1518-N6/adenine1519-N6)-dimethyltransferase